MKFVFLLSLFCVLVVTSRAAVKYVNGANAGYPHQCFLRGLRFYPGNDARRPNVCEKLTCENDLNIRIETCDDPTGLLNPSAPFPQCCQKA